ncbi:MAG: pantetheine-phosphate adenylyltransferase [Clostridia bacterium]|nr:pantetheine-phosphate adenylyltransferase [Clostridia bacterium]MBR3553074.1 pantetheine-phosphate adenylyltransferase [Clostridia bacterium]
MKQIAIYPGSFDPVTIGHLDIIRRSAQIFDRLIVVVMMNHRKVGNYTFTLTERMELIRKCVDDLPNVSVDCDDGLLADYARRNQATVIVKGLRAVSDFEDEFLQALTNKRLNPAVETVFMAASSENMFMSSSMIKQVCTLGGDISGFLPDPVRDEIIARLSERA